MQENIEKLISHYECELIKEDLKEQKSNEKIIVLEKIIEDLKEIIEKENEKNSPNSKNKKNKKKRNNIKKQEFVKSSIEPELIPRKIKKEF